MGATTPYSGSMSGTGMKKRRKSTSWLTAQVYKRLMWPSMGFMAKRTNRRRQSSGEGLEDSCVAAGTRWCLILPKTVFASCMVEAEVWRWLSLRAVPCRSAALKVIDHPAIAFPTVKVKSLPQFHVQGQAWIPRDLIVKKPTCRPGCWEPGKRKPMPLRSALAQYHEPPSQT